MFDEYSEKKRYNEDYNNLLKNYLSKKTSEEQMRILNIVSYFGPLLEQIIINPEIKADIEILLKNQEKQVKTTVDVFNKFLDLLDKDLFDVLFSLFEHTFNKIENEFGYKLPLQNMRLLASQIHLLPQLINLYTKRNPDPFSQSLLLMIEKLQNPDFSPFFEPENLNNLAENASVFVEENIQNPLKPDRKLLQFLIFGSPKNVIKIIKCSWASIFKEKEEINNSNNEKKGENEISKKVDFNHIEPTGLELIDLFYDILEEYALNLHNLIGKSLKNSEKDSLKKENSKENSKKILFPKSKIEKSFKFFLEGVFIIRENLKKGNFISYEDIPLQIENIRNNLYRKQNVLLSVFLLMQLIHFLNLIRPSITKQIFKDLKNEKDKNLYLNEKEEKLIKSLNEEWNYPKLNNSKISIIESLLSLKKLALDLLNKINLLQNLIINIMWYFNFYLQKNILSYFENIVKLKPEIYFLLDEELKNLSKNDFSNKISQLFWKYIIYEYINKNIEETDPEHSSNIKEIILEILKNEEIKKACLLIVNKIIR